MPKGVRRSNNDYLRFQPYRAIVASPVTPRAEPRLGLIWKTVIFVLLALAVGAAVYFFPS